MSFFSTWEDESADEMRQRLEAEVWRRQSQSQYNFYHNSAFNQAGTHDNGSGAMNREKYYEKIRADVRQRQRGQMEETIRKLFQNIIDQLNQVESDFKKFNSEWDTEGRAACVTFRVLQEHIALAKAGVNIAMNTCLDLSKP
jgi:excinuclease UvrABC helicase subunit UvrB